MALRHAIGRTDTNKRLSVVLAGYCYDEIPPRAYYWLVSNFENIDGHLLARGQAAKEFKLGYHRETRPTEVDPHFIIMAGNDRGVSDEHFEGILVLLRQHKPPEALVGKVVEVLRAAAKSYRSGNTVGEQCMSIVLPSDPAAKVVGQYHSTKVAYKLYQPTVIEARGGEFGVYVLADPELEARHDSGRPAILGIPRVGRNRPCPCGSGLKYKRCHGHPTTGSPPG